MARKAWTAPLASYNWALHREESPIWYGRSMPDYTDGLLAHIRDRDRPP